MSNLFLESSKQIIQLLDFAYRILHKIDYKNQSWSPSKKHFKFLFRVPIFFAGMPAYTPYSSQSFVTTAPQATTQPSPIVTPGRIIVLLLIQHLLPILTGAHSNAKSSDCRLCCPVQIFTSEERLQFEPIARPPRPSIRLSSPIMVSFPIVIAECFLSIYHHHQGFNESPLP